MKKSTLYAILLIIAIAVTVFLFGCEKPSTSDYVCDGKVIRSSPGYLQDTTLYEMTKLNVSDEDISWFVSNRTYTITQVQNGVFVTTVSTLVCKEVERVEIK